MHQWHEDALTDAYLRDMPLHALRHTTAAAWLASGQPLMFVQRQLRHRSITTTESHYGHLEAFFVKDAAARTEANGAFTQHYDTTALDASLLLIPLLRFLPSDDARVRATVLSIQDELSEDGLVQRYRVEETDDGLSGEEGAFVICSFWLVSALIEIGDIEAGRDLCARLLHDAGSLELYAEEIDARSRRHLGNFPQAFSHLALINAVLHVIRTEHGDPNASGAFEPGRAPGHPDVTRGS